MRPATLVASLLLIAACGDSMPPAEPADAATTDAAAPDSAPPDSAPLDAGGDADADAALVDAAAVDAAAVDAAAVDAAAVDAAALDAGPIDAALDGPPPDAAPPIDAAPDAALPPLGGSVFGIAHTSTTTQLVRVPLDGGPALELSRRDGTVYDFVRSPDGRDVYFRGNQAGGYRLYRVRADGSGTALALSPPGTSPGSYALSADGVRVAFDVYDGSTRQLYTVGRDGENLVRVSGDREVSDWAWIPGSSRIWYRDITEPGFGSLAETCAVTDCRRVIDPARSVTEFRFSPTGAHVVWTRLVGNGPEETMVMMDLATEHRVEVTSGRSYGPLVWSPDGQRLAYSAFGGQGPLVPTTVRADGTGAVELPTAFAATDHVTRWSPDSRHLLSFMQRGQSPSTTFHLFVFCGDGTCRDDLEVPNDQLSVWETWSPDGRVVHRVIRPGNQAGVHVADCPQAACGQVRASGDQTVQAPPVWASGSSRYAFASAAGTWIVDALGAPPRAISPFSSSILRFDAGGQRVLTFRDDHVRAVRIDGSEDRNLDLSLPAGTLSLYRLEPVD